MTVYPERNKGGSYTGVWIVETRHNGERRRQRAQTWEEAKKLEEGIPKAEAKAFTLADLDKRAAHLFWRGRKDALQSSRRWQTAIELLGKKTPVVEVRKLALEVLVDKLRDQGLSPKTVNRYLASVSRALRWAHEADYIQGMPSIPWQKEGEGRKLWLPEENTEAFLGYIRDYYGSHYEFAAEVLLLTGMRVNELLSLTSTEVEGDVIHLTNTKTDAPRSLPLPEGYGEWLRFWCDCGGVYYRALLEAIGAASEKVCGKRLTPHALRHTAATRLTAAGVPTLTVAEIMGHKNLKTTQGYTHLMVSTLRDAMATLVRGNSGAKRGGGVVKREENTSGHTPARLCSPLRSHSATRPSALRQQGLTSPEGDTQEP